jgi:hypothetical protein
MRSRLALLAVAALAGLALTACQRDPSVAATVGSDKITEAQVDAIIADAQHNRPNPATASPSPEASPGASPAPSPAPAAPLGPVQINRADVVRYLVLDKMCAADQARRHFANGQPADISEVKQISPDSEYNKLFAHMTACLNGLVTGIAPVTPTDAEAREIYDRAAAQGLDVPAFDQVKDQLVQSQEVQQRIAIKRTLEDQSKAQNVSVSPRYRPIEFGLLPSSSDEPIPFEGPQLLVATIGQPTDAIQQG